MALTSTLTDNFDDNSIDTDKWNFGDPAYVKEQNRRIEISTQTVPAYYTLNSVNEYDLDQVSIELVSVGNLDLPSYEAYPLEVYLSSSNRYIIFILGDDNNIYYRKRAGGVNTTFSETYSETEHRFLRIKKSGDNVLFQKSVDGENWNTALETAKGFDPVDITVKTYAGAWDSEASATTMIVDNFNTISTLDQATEKVRKPKHTIGVSWKRDKNIAYVDTSEVDDLTEVVKPAYGWRVGIDPIDFGGAFEDRVIGGATKFGYESGKYFEFYDESDRTMQISYKRKLAEPLGAIQQSSLHLVFSNTDLHFTFGYDSNYGDYMYSNRPFEFRAGFKKDGLTTLTTLMYGMFETPNENKTNRTLEVVGIDAIEFLADEYVQQTTVFQDVRSDVVIESLLEAVGFSSGRMDFDEGLNTIEFAVFEKGKKLINAIKEICEAEGATIYQDTDGRIAFRTRNNLPTTKVHSLGFDVISWQQDRSTPIINRCEVYSNPREVITGQQFYTLDQPLQVLAGETEEFFVEFENPVTASTEETYSANTNSTGTGTNLSSSFDVSITLFTNAMLVKVTNNGLVDGYLTLLQMTGSVALPIYKNGLQVVYEDEQSIEEFGLQEYKIESKYLDDLDFAKYLVQAIVEKYTSREATNYMDRIKVTIPAIPDLEINDVIEMDNPDTGEAENYRVMSIEGSMSQTSGFVNNLVLRRIRADETKVYS